MNLAELRNRAARGETLTPNEMEILADHLEALDDQIVRLESKVAQRGVTISLMEQMNKLLLISSSKTRTIDEIRKEVNEGPDRDKSLYNAFEVRQIVYAFDHSEQQRMALVKTHETLLQHGTVAAGLQKTIDDIDAGVVRPFSFQDVAALLAAHRSSTSLGRSMRTNVREIFQLLKAQPNALFHGHEVALVRKWGTDHDRNCSMVKARLGRAFTDPVGYMDPRFDMMLSKVTKRQLLDGQVINQQSYQHAVFARPDFLKTPEDWVLCDGKTQFHAGEYFHTRACDGMWWSGQHFSELTGPQLMKILEETLADLRLLYIHYPNGVNNEAE